MNKRGENAGRVAALIGGVNLPCPGELRENYRVPELWLIAYAHKEDFKGIQKEPEGSSIWMRRGWMVRILKASEALVKRKVSWGWPS